MQFQPRRLNSNELAYLNRNFLEEDMVIVLFLIDNSGSMNQRVFFSNKSSSFLDLAKETVERFIKVRQRDPQSKIDRYMLLTFEDVPNNIKAGWKENLNQFFSELKNITATGLTTINVALKNSFDYLNLNRMQNGVDIYGYGRLPFYQESAVVILFTDGGKYTSNTNVQEDINIPTSHGPGSELNSEPFRWDQRLYTIVLRLPSQEFGCSVNKNESIASVSSDESPINALCETTGGRSFCIRNRNDLSLAVDYLVTKVVNGVIVRFEKFGPDPPLIIPNGTNSEKVNNNNSKAWHNTRAMIQVRLTSKNGSITYWPIPESFWPDSSMTTLPPRTAQPIIKFTCSNFDPSVIGNHIPFNKYELDSNLLTDYFLSRKQPDIAWQVFVANSSRSPDIGLPFGYLKANSDLSCVNLFLLPYNYPMLSTLFDECVAQPSLSRELRQQMENYLKFMPIYYAKPLRATLGKVNPALIPLINENFENLYGLMVNNIVKKHKNIAKIEIEKLQAIMSQPKSINIEWPRINNNLSLISNSRKMTSDLFCSNPSLKIAFAGKFNEFQDYNGMVIRYKDKVQHEKISILQHPSEVPREKLFTQISKLCRVFFSGNLDLAKINEEDHMFNLPISQMGNYQEYLKRKQNPLREIEAQPTRTQLFGNPFKINKGNVMIDEADVDLSGNQPSRGTKRSSDSVASKSKRKPGALSRDISYSCLISKSRPTSPISPYGFNPSSLTVNNSSSKPITISVPDYSNHHMTNQMFVNNNPSSSNNSHHHPAPIIFQSSNQISSNNLHLTKRDIRKINQTKTNSQPQSQLVNNLVNANHKNYFPSSNGISNSHQNRLVTNKSSNPSMMNCNEVTTSNNQRIDLMKASVYFQSKPNLLMKNICNPESYPNPHPSSMNGFRSSQLDPTNGMILTPEQQSRLELVLRSVRMKDERTLFQNLAENRGKFGDFLLIQAVLYARRYMMHPMIDKLSRQYPEKVSKTLKMLETKKIIN
ncbi:hypothetical protein NH340_JMT05892 [Sarcoptes scabiei]|nr:hypothetical protein NH340_JMT05892 [Sarcoptes scabiei]